MSGRPDTRSHAIWLALNANSKGLGVSKAQADEKALADAVMNRYQTVPAYHSVAINGVPTEAFAAAK